MLERAVVCEGEGRPGIDAMIPAADHGLPVRTGSFQIAGHYLFYHLHRFLDGLPCILPLDPVEFLQGAQCPGIPEHAQCKGSFQPHPCIVIPQGVNQRLHGPGISQPSQRFRRIPPRPLIIIGELFDQGLKSIRRCISPFPDGWLFLSGAWQESSRIQYAPGGTSFFPF